MPLLVLSMRRRICRCEAGLVDATMDRRELACRNGTVMLFVALVLAALFTLESSTMSRYVSSTVAAFVVCLMMSVRAAEAQTFRVFPDGSLPSDCRLDELQTLNGYFPFQRVENTEQWQRRRSEIKRRLLISQGLWPEPSKTNLNAVVHGRVEQDDYTIDRVYFESIPGHFVTGSLYRPKQFEGKIPAVLCPHGHWQDARFYDAGESAARQLIAIGAERFENAARNHLQARCVQLARMGCAAFFYDMTGNSDSTQIGHRPDQSDHLNRPEDWGFFSVQADLRLHHMMGLQTWNSIRAIDFLLELPEVDPQRLGVTGASGGGTQSMIIAAIDERIAAAMPCVMVSTAMQGGCTCENAPLMRIGQGNIDIAAAIAPRPLGLTAADDWTVDLETKGYPDLKELYEMLGHKNRLTAAFHTHFRHNYNHVNRTVMYDFFNRHFHLGLKSPVLESDFELMGEDELTVWSDEHPAPTGDAIGDRHEVRLLKIAAYDSKKVVDDLIPVNADQLNKYREVIGGAWETILARQIDQVGELKFTKTKSDQIDDVAVTLGRLDHVGMEEQLPVMTLQSGILQSGESPSKGVIVWITDTGKNGLLEDGILIPLCKAAISGGYTIVAADLFGQGEFLSKEDGLGEREGNRQLSRQRMWQQRDGQATWQRFSGYTYGYNHCVFVRRTHDVLTLIQYASALAGGKPVKLAGLGRAAGPIALAALSQSGDRVAEALIDVDQFSFGEIDQHDDAMFVPGAVKYLGVDGLLSLCAPRKVTVSGLKEHGVGSSIYQISGAADNLTLVDDIETMSDSF